MDGMQDGQSADIRDEVEAQASEEGPERAPVEEPPGRSEAPEREAGSAPDAPVTASLADQPPVSTATAAPPAEAAAAAEASDEPEAVSGEPPEPAADSAVPPADAAPAVAGAEEEQASLDEMVESLKAAAAAAVTEDVAVPAAPAGIDEEPGADVEASEVSAEAEVETGSAEPLVSEVPSEAPALVRDGLSARLPFWIYAGVWAAFSVAMTVLLWPESTKPFINDTLYAIFTLGGTALAIAGPVLGLSVWVALRVRSAPSVRDGLVRAAFMRAALWTLFGVASWWVALVILDLNRQGFFG
jgi:hypothetical protein